MLDHDDGDAELCDLADQLERVGDLRRIETGIDLVEHEQARFHGETLGELETLAARQRQRGGRPVGQLRKAGKFELPAGGGVLSARPSHDSPCGPVAPVCIDGHEPAAFDQSFGQLYRAAAILHSDGTGGTSIEFSCGNGGGPRSGRSLDDFVLEGCNRQRALPPIRLGYINPPRRQCPIRSPLDPVVQVLELALEVCLVGRPRQSVHTRRAARKGWQHRDMRAPSTSAR